VEGFIKRKLRTELWKTLADAREKLGFVSWGQFKTFLVVFDRKLDSIAIERELLLA
jgi:hypothetical protein